MVFVKKSIFFLYVLFKQKRKKETFFNILDRKQSFLDLKSEVLKKSTICKRVTPWFLLKNRPFPHICFFRKKSQKETVFYILERKEFFLHLKS